MKKNLKIFAVLVLGIIIGILFGKLSFSTQSEQRGVKVEFYKKTTTPAPQVLTQQKLDKALLRAARRADVQGVEKALELGADIDATDRRGRTALMIALSDRHWSYKKILAEMDIAVLLLKEGADVHNKDKRQLRALNYADSFYRGKTDWQSDTRRNLIWNRIYKIQNLLAYIEKNE